MRAASRAAVREEQGRPGREEEQDSADSGHVASEAINAQTTDRDRHGATDHRPLSRG